MKIEDEPDGWYEWKEDMMESDERGACQICSRFLFYEDIEQISRSHGSARGLHQKRGQDHFGVSSIVSWQHRISMEGTRKIPST